MVDIVCEEWGKNKKDKTLHSSSYNYAHVFKNCLVKKASGYGSKKLSPYPQD
jgi:hypothetical protein